MVLVFPQIARFDLQKFLLENLSLSRRRRWQNTRSMRWFGWWCHPWVRAAIYDCAQISWSGPVSIHQLTHFWLFSKYELEFYSICRRVRITSKDYWWTNQPLHVCGNQDFGRDGHFKEGCEDRVSVNSRQHRHYFLPGVSKERNT